jgi:subtilisin-like proprotein convertase family protein
VNLEGVRTSGPWCHPERLRTSLDWFVRALSVWGVVWCSISMGATIEVRDSGQNRVFEIVSEFIPEDSMAGGIGLPGLLVGETRTVLYEKGRTRTEFARRVPTGRVLVRLAQGVEERRVFVGEPNVEGVDDAPGYFLLEAEGRDAALELALKYRGREGVLSAEPVLGRKSVRKFLPNDPFFIYDWHLLNWGQFGGARRLDLNVTNVWDRFRGNGILVAVVDDGVQRTHPDLTENIDTRFQYDFRDGDADASPRGSDDFHGTAISGVVAGRGNNDVGIVGVAFEASLVPVRLIGGFDQSDEQDALAMAQGGAAVSVSSNAWGAEDTGRSLEGPGPLMQKAIEKAVVEGRGGRGTIFVWAGGNGGEVGDNMNYDGYANAIQTIAVGSVDDGGTRAVYSEPGACLVVVAPSSGPLDSIRPGIMTTDLTGDDGLNYFGSTGDTSDVNYTKTFGGTSASSAAVSGVVALVLESNPELGWRDVQEILMRSARQLEPGNSSWRINQAGFHFSPLYGAGLIDAGEAVGLARGWRNLGEQKRFVMEASGLGQTIPDNNAVGLIRTFLIPQSQRLRVEHATLSTRIRHARRGDLAISLISPHGTESPMTELHSDFTADYEDWTFMSVFHWGELSDGEWKVKVVDRRARNTGVLESVRIELFGTSDFAGAGWVLQPRGLDGDGFRFSLGGAGGARVALQTSLDLLLWTTLVETNVPPEAAGLELKVPVGNRVVGRFYRVIGNAVE